MANSQRNKMFLDATDEQTRTDLIGSISANYRLTPKEVYEELVGADAESILDYLTGGHRRAAYALMQRHGLT